jgi:hypothetical protein
MLAAWERPMERIGTAALAAVGARSGAGVAVASFDMA